MKTLRLFAVGLMFTALFAVSAFAQAGGAQSASVTGKIGLIDTSLFADEKAGITRYKTALKTLETEFKAANDDLRASTTKLQSLSKEIETLRSPGATPVNTSTLNAKAEEYENLRKDIARKTEDAKVRYEKRYQAIVDPVFGDILKALTEYAKKNGYAVILDGAKLEQAGILMGFDEKYNVTSEFIQFYNARPAGAATTTTKPN